MDDQRVPTPAEVRSYLTERNNWGRWGEGAGKGAVNLITPEKKVAAAGLVRTGRAVSLSRPFPVTAHPDNPRPAQQILFTMSRPPGGAALDYYGVAYHGLVSTHVDALCHVWDENGMWEGRDPNEALSFSGANFGGIDEWREGILTRGVFLDVPRYRGVACVTLDDPVHGWELEAIARHESINIEPGDAVVIYSGREAYEKENGGTYASGTGSRPGLHASCLAFIRDNDIAVLAWDMIDAMPNEYDLPWPVHGAIFAFGVAIVDHCALQELAAACVTEGRYEFLFSVNPLYVEGGTGSPANPVVVF